MHNIKTNFDKVLNVIKEIIDNQSCPNGNFLRPGPKPKFTDIEVLALSLTAECLSIDSENLLFVKLRTEYQNDFKNMISRRQYNDRRKMLFDKAESIRKAMAARLNQQADVFAITAVR